MRSKTRCYGIVCMVFCVVFCIVSSAWAGIDWMYVQHRQYEDGRAFMRLGFGIVDDDTGSYITSPSAVENVVLKDPDGNTVQLDRTISRAFWDEEYMSGFGTDWDQEMNIQRFDGEPVWKYDSGFTFNLPDDIAPGVYTLEVTAFGGKTYTQSYNWSGKVENLPIISYGTFQVRSDDAGNLLWTWEQPPGMADYANNHPLELRVIVDIYEDDAFVANVSLWRGWDSNAYFFPKEIVDMINAKGDAFELMIQARSADRRENTYNYNDERTYSKVLRMTKFGDFPTSVDGGYHATDNFWVKAVMHPVGMSDVTLKWRHSGIYVSDAGDTTVYGYFYADSKDFAYGSFGNPEVDCIQVE